MTESLQTLVIPHGADTRLTARENDHAPSLVFCGAFTVVESDDGLRLGSSKR